MQFFLYEIVARLVALYLIGDCWRLLSHGLAERKIEYANYEILNWIPRRDVHRDAAPVWYWMLIVGEAFTLMACVIVAIFGWWHPST